jgi:hypothetical protein
MSWGSVSVGSWNDIGGRETYGPNVLEKISQITYPAISWKELVGLTNVTEEDEEIVVSQSSVLIRVQKSINIQTILSRIGLNDND